MSKFNTSTRKLQTIWERVQKNISEIRNKDNINQFEFFTNLLKQQNIKVPIQLFDSGNINLVPTTIGGVNTVLKGELMPTEASYSENIDIQIPEIFLPFIKYSVEINSLPDTEIHGAISYDISDFVDDSVEIRGDGSLIFKIDPLPTSGAIGGVENVFPDTFFTSNSILFDLSKEVWKGTITKNDDSVKSLNVIHLTTTIITETGAGNCTGSNGSEKFIVDLLNDGEHKLISLTSTSFTAVGDLLVTTIFDNGSSCEITEVLTENVTKTFSFSSVDSYTITLSDGLIIPSSDIKNKEFERNNRWLFWSTLKQKLFSLIITSTDDGDFKEIIPSNFLDTDDGDTLPYTSITLKRNIVEVPDEIGKASRIATSEREFKNYVRTSSSDASIPTYRFRLNGDFIILSPATKENFKTRTKNQITSQEFKLIGGSKFNVAINKGLGSYLSGTINNIFHRKEVVNGGETTITEFFTDPINNPGHSILSLNSTTFTAVGDETITVIPVEGDSIVTKKNNITDTKVFADATTYSIGINDTTDFPTYNDIYTIVDTTYSLTTENHSIFPKDIWLPETQDIIINIKAYLVNPLYWREQRRYNKNDF